MKRWGLCFLLSALVLACGDEGGSASGGGGAGGAGSGTGTGSGTGSGTASSGSGWSGGQTCSGEPTHTGDGTYYGADGSGNCSFDPSPNDLMVGAMNHTDYAGSAPCGACAHVTGPSGEVWVRIVDQCPECAPGDIDLSPQAFEKIAPLSAGRVDISWTYVPCNVSGPIVYHFKEGSNQWWTAVQIRNHRNAIAKVEFKDDNGNYVSVQRLDYNYFVADQGMGPGPYSFRVTDVYGNALEDTGIPFNEAGDSPGAGQFPECAN